MTQKEFYHSRAWMLTSRAFLRSKNYLCERCGDPAAIAHHKIYLDDAKANDPAIALSWDNLEALCLACHNAEHFGNGGACAPGLGFDESGNLIRKGGKDDAEKEL